MAESAPIKANELIQPDVFANTVESAKTLNAELAIAVDGLKAVISANATLMKQAKGESSADLKERLNLIKENKATRLALIEVEKVQALNNEKIAQAELKTSAAKLKSDQAELKSAQQKEKQSQQNAKAASNEASAYKKLSDQLNVQKKAVQDLLASEKALSEQDKILIKNTQDLDAKLKAIDATVGNNTRNVGNYKSGFNGLSNSINQLTREAPAFANSVQTGFMAISNNLPIFFDEISRARKGIEELRAQGEKVPSLFSQLTSSVLSWGTALSLGVTLLTFFGKAIGEFVVDLFKADKALKISTETQSKYYTELTDKINEVIDAQIRLNVLNGKWTEEQAKNFKDGRELNKKISADNKFLRDEIVKQTAEWGIELTDVWDEKNKKIKLLSEGAIMTEQLRRSKDVFEEIKLNKGRNKILRELFTDYTKLVEEDKKGFDLKVAATTKEADIEAAKEAKKAKDKRLQEQDDETIRQMEIIRERREKADKIMTDFNNKEGVFKPEKTEETEWYDKENGITVDDHNQTLKDIEATRLKAIEDARLAAIKKAETEVALAQKTTSALKVELDAQNANKIKSLDMQIAADQRAIERQFLLAVDGQDNILAETERRAAQDELRKRDQLERERRQKEAIAFSEAYLNAYNAELKQPNANPTTAATKALGDVLLAKGIAKGIAALASFFDGTEDTGNGGGLDKKGGFLAVLHPNERVVTADQNKKMKGISNNELTDIAMKYNTGQLIDMSPKLSMERSGSFADNFLQSAMLNSLTKNNELLQAIADKPVQTMDIEKLHNRIDTIETMHYKNYKEKIRHKGTTRLQWGA